MFLVHKRELHNTWFLNSSSTATKREELGMEDMAVVQNRGDTRKNVLS